MESAKKAARVDARGQPGHARRRPSPTERSRSARSAATGSATPPRSPSAVAALLGQVDGQQGYLAVMAYLDRLAHADLAEVRDTLAHRVPAAR